MAGLVEIKGFDELVINICPINTQGEVFELSGLYIQMPKVPPHGKILFHNLKKKTRDGHVKNLQKS